MQAIKGIIAASALMFALNAMPNSATADSSAVGLDPLRPWGQFSFGAQDTFALPGTAANSSVPNDFDLLDPPWIFTGAGFLIVQDAFTSGDRFRVFDNGAPIGETSLPGAPQDFCGGDVNFPQNGSNPVDCFLNFPQASRGIFPLAAGPHSFEIQVTLSPFGGGAAFLCIDTGAGNCGVGPIGAAPVSEPSSLLLLGFALIGAWCWSRREQLRKCYVVLLHKRRRR